MLMTVVQVGPPAWVEAALSIPQGVDFEAWLNWVDAAGATLPLSAFHAALAFSAGGAGETVPPLISDTTSAATVGRISLADASPNMRLAIPAAVTETLAFRRLRAVLDVTDAAGVKRRWMEATVTLDRGTGF